jgi:hypothetical protein
MFCAFELEKPQRCAAKGAARISSIAWGAPPEPFFSILL